MYEYLLQEKHEEETKEKGEVGPAAAVDEDDKLNPFFSPTSQTKQITGKFPQKII